MPMRGAIALLFACLLLWARSACADERAEAQEFFEAGVTLQKAEDFDSAIAAFESSLSLFPTRSALFNLANCLQATHRYPEALEALQRLQREYGAELEEPMRGRVTIQRAELETLTAFLLVRVDQPGAEVRVDGKLVGRTPLAEPLLLALGDHEVEVTLRGFANQQRRVNLGQ
jgi:tetratricopeptide (TPR) repeat protein